MPRTVGRQVHRANIGANNARDYFKINVFLPYLDYYIVTLQERFTNHKNIIDSFVNCLLRKSGNIENEFLKLVQVYRENEFIFENSDAILEAEVKLWQRKLSDNHFKNAIDAYASCNETIFPNIKKLLKIFATLPVTSCTSERSFSTLRRLLTYLRSTTGSNRLNGLALLNIHPDITVSSEEVLNEMSKVKRRLNINI